MLHIKFLESHTVCLSFTKYTILNTIKGHLMTVQELLITESAYNTCAENYLKTDFQYE
jgi:hypothetical protein